MATHAVLYRSNFRKPGTLSIAADVEAEHADEAVRIVAAKPFVAEVLGVTRGGGYNQIRPVLNQPRTDQYGDITEITLG